MKFHFHRDPDWQQNGVYRYDVCSCGARRVRQVNFRGYSPLKQGWEGMLTTKHNTYLIDSGWVKPKINKEEPAK